ncbi:MAG: carboxymuconolactone decarboxylase family protein [Enterobacteriaceae bacterium]
MSSQVRFCMDSTEFTQLVPDVAPALRALSQAVNASGLEKTLIEMLKIRVSQLNGCAFCLQSHINMARQEGVDSAKIDLIAAWREADLYSSRERAALAWAEALTKMAQGSVKMVVTSALEAHFSPQEIANLTTAIATINTWNRIAGGLHFTPPASKPAKPQSETVPSE